MAKLNRRAALGAAGTALVMAALPAGAVSAQESDCTTAATGTQAPACGPQVSITVPYAFGLTGSPQIFQHTHAFSVTLAAGTLVDGATVTVVGATSGVLQHFPQHTHRINGSGVLGAPCGFHTADGEHAFTLHAADFVLPSQP